LSLTYSIELVKRKNKPRNNDLLYIQLTHSL